MDAMTTPPDPAPSRRDPLALYLDKAVPEAWRAVGPLAEAVAAAGAAAGLDRGLMELVNLRVSQINGCAYCLDLHVRRGREAGLTTQRIALLSAWRDTPAVYSEVERAALELAETATSLPEQDQREYVQVAAHAVLTDEQYAVVQWAAALMGLTNRISIMSHHPVRRRDD